MPSAYITNLLTRRDTISAELAALELGNGLPGSLPNLKYSDGGPTIDHDKYKQRLYWELDKINEQILNAATVEAALDDDDNGPFEHATVMQP